MVDEPTIWLGYVYKYPKNIVYKKHAQGVCSLQIHILYCQFALVLVCMQVQKYKYKLATQYVNLEGQTAWAGYQYQFPQWQHDPTTNQIAALGRRHGGGEGNSLPGSFVTVKVSWRIGWINRTKAPKSNFRQPLWEEVIRWEKTGERENVAFLFFPQSGLRFKLF